MDLYVVNTNAPFDLDVTLDGDSLRLTVVNQELANPFDRVLSLSALRNRPDFGDHALYLIYDLSTGSSVEIDPGEYAQTVSNLYALTLSSKMEAGTYHRVVTQKFPLAAIYVPLASSPVEEWALGVRVAPTATVSVSKNIVKKQGITIPAIGETVIFPVVRFLTDTATVAVDGSVSIPFRLEAPDGAAITNREAEVYLESTSGYLVERRVRTVEGAGVATFRPDGLASGAKARVKAGFKFFSGTDDCEVTVQ